MLRQLLIWFCLAAVSPLWLDCAPAQERIPSDQDVAASKQAAVEAESYAKTKQTQAKDAAKVVERMRMDHETAKQIAKETRAASEAAPGDASKKKQAGDAEREVTKRQKALNNAIDEARRNQSEADHANSIADEKKKVAVERGQPFDTRALAKAAARPEAAPRLKEFVSFATGFFVLVSICVAIFNKRDIARFTKAKTELEGEIQSLNSTIVELKGRADGLRKSFPPSPSEKPPRIDPPPPPPPPKPAPEESRSIYARNPGTVPGPNVTKWQPGNTEYGPNEATRRTFSARPSQAQPFMPPTYTRPSFPPSQPVHPLQNRSSLSGLVTSYENACSDASGNARAAFESRYKVTRISCLNLQERKLQPTVTLRFEEHPQGWFMAIGDPAEPELALLPWYGFEFDLEPERWRHMFSYPPNASAHYVVTRPGKLKPLDNGWIMTQPGEFGNG